MRFAKSLLVLTLAVTVSHVSPRTVYYSSLTPLELLHHVANNEFHWRHILNEHIINLGMAPYHNRILGVINPGETNPRVILYRVLYGFSNIGSYVDYAAFAVHKSLACYSVKHLAFQSHYLSRMFSKAADPGVIQVELERIKVTTTLILDKMVILPADLSNLFEIYWESISLMQYEIGHYARFRKYPDNSSKNMDEIHIRIKGFLEHHCAHQVVDGRFLFNMEIDVNYLLMDEVLNLMVDVKELTRLSEKHENFVTAYYTNLAYETLPKLQWSGIFYYTKPSNAIENPRETNAPITTPPTDVDASTNVNESGTRDIAIAGGSVI